MTAGDGTALARFCSTCGRERLPGARFCVGCGREFPDPLVVTERPPAEVELLPANPYPVRYQAPYLARRSRPRTVFRSVLSVPHRLLLVPMIVLSLLLSPVGWLAALVLGRLPGPIHRYQAATLAYATQVGAYASLVTDRWPAFPLQSRRHDYPVQVLVAPPAPLRRLRTLVVLPAAVPAAVTALLFAVVRWMLVVGAWWAIVFTGRMPQTIDDMLELAIGFECRTLGYLPLLLTGVYPWYESGPLMLRSRRPHAGEASEAGLPPTEGPLRAS